MNFIERFDKPLEYIGVVQTLLIALQYLYMWIFADLSDAYIVYSMGVLMGFEFIMVHSGVFMALMPVKVSLFVFFPLYGLFALVFNMAMMGKGDNTIIIIYLTVVLNRMRFAFSKPNKEIIGRATSLSIIAVVCYFFLAFIVTFASPIIPKFSLGPSFYESETYRNVAHNTGLFTEKPYTSICMGFMYYTLISFANIMMIRNWKTVSVKYSGNKP